MRKEETFASDIEIKVSHSSKLSHSSMREGIQVFSAWELLSVTAANNGTFRVFRGSVGV